MEDVYVIVDILMITKRQYASNVQQLLVDANNVKIGDHVQLVLQVCIQMQVVLYVQHASQHA